MDATKRKFLEAAGWKVGDAADFLEMSDEERQLLERAGRLLADGSTEDVRNWAGLGFGFQRQISCTDGAPTRMFSIVSWLASPWR